MLIKYAELSREIEAMHGAYNRAYPYPFAIFDGLFADSALAEVNREIDESAFIKDARDISGVEIKTRSNFEDNEAVPPATRKLFEVLNGGKFLSLVSRLTGIDGLISDPYYDGGGINVIEDGGTLAVHVDGTRQRRMNVCRRLNAILFLNDEWDPEWNGYHEQWVYENPELDAFDEGQRWKCVRKILPKKNRLLVFTTNDHSWHGHAGPLSVPKGVQRRSLITYYYTVDRPEQDLVYSEPHRALFVNNEITLRDPDAYASAEVVL